MHNMFSMYLSEANFGLYVLHSLLKDINESSRRNACAVDARLVNVALQTECEGTVLKPALQQVTVDYKVHFVASDTHPALGW